MNEDELEALMAQIDAFDHNDRVRQVPAKVQQGIEEGLDRIDALRLALHEVNE